MPVVLTVLFTTLGGLFLAGLATDLIGRRTRLPRVSLLLLFGFGIGPTGLNIVPELSAQWQEGITEIALVMVGFLLGEHLTAKQLKRRGRDVLWISIAVTIVTGVVVAGGLILIGIDPVLAMLLGGIATATDPLATLDVAREQRSEGPFTGTLLNVVAIDDAWGLLLFTFVLIAAELLSGHAGGSAVITHGLYELLGSIGLGLGLGLPMAMLSGRLRDGEPTQAEALGFVFLCAGLALLFELSSMLAAMVMGMTVANVAKHHQYSFHAIEGIEWPFMILFFILAGASLQLPALLSAGLLTGAFVVLRIVGRLLGNHLGARAAGSSILIRRWLGLAMLPQAGVATGMALLAANRFPALADTLISLVISTTVLFEIIGPVATRFALNRVGESGADQT